jgi:hypothetical protein
MTDQSNADAVPLNQSSADTTTPHQLGADASPSNQSGADVSDPPADAIRQSRSAITGVLCKRVLACIKWKQGCDTGIDS